MSRFFINDENINGDIITVTGEDAAHIAKVLRYAVDDELLCCHTDTAMEYVCKILTITKDFVTAIIVKTQENETEDRIKIYLYQAIPKGDKMDFIIQKAVELGVYTIIPVNTIRCVSKPDEKSKQKKIIRYNKLTVEAAKQCGRGYIPEVLDYMEYISALEHAKKHDINIMFYENSTDSITDAIKNFPNAIKSIGIFIGSEGGFDIKEIDMLKKYNIFICSLGKLILRCETAGIVAVTQIKYIINSLL